MVVNSKIRDSDWLTFTLTIVNFNYVLIQPAPACLNRHYVVLEFHDISVDMEKYSKKNQIQYESVIQSKFIVQRFD